MGHIHTTVDELSFIDAVSVFTGDMNTQLCRRLKRCGGNRAKEVMFVILAKYYSASVSPVDRSASFFCCSSLNRQCVCEQKTGTESRQWVFHLQRLCEYGPERLSNKHTQRLNGLFLKKTTPPPKKQNKKLTLNI